MYFEYNKMHKFSAQDALVKLVPTSNFHSHRRTSVIFEEVRSNDARGCHPTLLPFHCARVSQADLWIFTSPKPEVLIVHIASGLQPRVICIFCVIT